MNRRSPPCARRPNPVVLLVAIALAAAALLTTACGSSKREKTLNTTLAAVNVARETFAAFDDSHQDAIIERATSLEQGRAELAAYREKQAKVVGLFIAAYRAIGVAAVASKDDASLRAAVDALKALTSAIDDLTKDEKP
jgi:hypothetical protein